MSITFGELYGFIFGAVAVGSFVLVYIGIRAWVVSRPKYVREDVLDTKLSKIWNDWAASQVRMKHYVKEEIEKQTRVDAKKWASMEHSGTE